MDTMKVGNNNCNMQEVIGMKSAITVHQVAGKQFKVWADYIMRAMYAQDEAGEVRMIRGSGYLNKDLSIRKAIANSFRLETFRK